MKSHAYFILDIKVVFIRNKLHNNIINSIALERDTQKSIVDIRRKIGKNQKACNTWNSKTTFILPWVTRRGSGSFSDMKKTKSLQQLEFPPGHPRKYYPIPLLLDL